MDDKLIEILDKLKTSLKESKEFLAFKQAQSALKKSSESLKHHALLESLKAELHEAIEHHNDTDPIKKRIQEYKISIKNDKILFAYYEALSDLSVLNDKIMKIINYPLS